MGVHRTRVYLLTKTCFYTNFKVRKRAPVFPPFSEIIRHNARWIVRAALWTLYPSALLRTARSLCKCCHKNCPTDCDEYERAISCAVSFEEKSKIENCTQEWERWEKSWVLSLINWNRMDIYSIRFLETCWFLVLSFLEIESWKVDTT